jgi:hypothetical protein
MTKLYICSSCCCSKWYDVPFKQCISCIHILFDKLQLEDKNLAVQNINENKLEYYFTELSKKYVNKKKQLHNARSNIITANTRWGYAYNIAYETDYHYSQNEIEIYKAYTKQLRSLINEVVIADISNIIYNYCWPNMERSALHKNEFNMESIILKDINEQNILVERIRKQNDVNERTRILTSYLLGLNINLSEDNSGIGRKFINRELDDTWTLERIGKRIGEYLWFNNYNAIGIFIRMAEDYLQNNPNYISDKNKMCPSVVSEVAEMLCLENNHGNYPKIWPWQL